MRVVCSVLFCVLFVLGGSGCGVLMSVSEHERVVGELSERVEREREEWRVWRVGEKKRELDEKRALLKRIETLREMRRVDLEKSVKREEELGVKMKSILDERDVLQLRVEEFEREKKKSEESLIGDRGLLSQEKGVFSEESEVESECGRGWSELECYAVALLGKKYFYDRVVDLLREVEGEYLSRGDIEKRRRRVLKRKNRWELCDRFGVGYGGVKLNEVTYFSNNNLVRFGLNGVRVEDKKFFELVGSNEDESGGWGVVVEKGLEICLSFRAAVGTSNEWDVDYGKWKRDRYVYAKPIEIWIRRGDQRVYKFSRRLVKKMVTPFKKTYYEEVYDKKRIYEVF